ncbi:Pre-mRNA-splicing factor CWC22-like protein [Armadillidium nasatum]|uniref:Pre-mRNA-splicing factor CWC22-like protein n=1 Tax=Armadillidium nasatum TaxID=96803 RepID=A0A5N5TK61_9CRUS|nr:Pre-mRNA-splicing factor CWC22-like protein [Armadillidium nasatum]
MQAQAFSPTFTHVYAALVAVINSKFPQIGELLLHRLVLQFRRGVKRNDKNSCMASCKFLAHLINQQVAHEVVALEILTMLLEKAKDIMDETPTGEKSRQSSVELSITFLKDCGMKLSELTPKGLMIIMETLRNILHEGKLDARYKYMIEVLMAIQKENFKDFPSVVDDLDLVEEGEQFTHVIELDGKLTTDDILNVFKLDPNYEENEKKYQDLKASILGESDDDDDDGDDDSGTEGDTEDSDSKDEESDNEEKKDEEGKPILDRTESNLIAFRRTVYLTIQSSLDVDECAHKLLKGEIKPGWEEELCNMIIDCCAQQRTYIKNPLRTYLKMLLKPCHRLEIEKLRNVAKLFAHLFFSDAISWEVMSCIHLNQDETTSSSRVFLKILFEELANFMGLCKLNERLREPTLSHAFEGLLPRDNPVNTRFAINFFTTIGLGGLTDDLREFLRSQTS